VKLAIDIWAANFTSKIPINVEATWQSDLDSTVLGSARPGFYFNAFPGAPDDDLWYPSALANALANKDLDAAQPEIYLRLNSKILWYTGVDGNPDQRSYDLKSVVLHEIGHGLGFLSNAEYDRFFGTGYMFQPTPFDAYVQLPDGRTFVDFCSRSADLGKAMVSPLVWSGPSGISAHGNNKPKLFSPSIYIEGSSITHRNSPQAQHEFLA
ncbi:MAG: RIP metalloprotease, partial [Actinobacteria bacterium]|nr:RIP metalloprotease [Actinomycetota bacterium]